MLAFTCPRCRSLVFFDSTSCVNCGAVLGYVPARRAFGEVVDGAHPTEPAPMVPCVNREEIGCNWLAGEHAAAGLCECCALTRTRPAASDQAGVAAWAAVESAKRQLVFQLDQLELPRTGPPELAFDLLSSAWEPVTTGHADGVITIDLAEGADSHREALRIDLAEPYRTVLGHLRHEVGHYYWLVLVDAPGTHERFRERFGDERADYACALREHYAGPDDRSWAGTHVSRYAAAHPWEDWAETFAHYLHIRDTLQTAAAWRITVGGPENGPADASSAPANTPPDPDFAELARSWLPLATALNAVNRSMGEDDLYPFLLTPVAEDKLAFVHDLVTANAAAPPGRPGS